MAESAVHWLPMHLQFKTSTFASLEATAELRQKVELERKKYLPAVTAVQVIQNLLYHQVPIAVNKMRKYTLDGYFGKDKWNIQNGKLEVRGLTVDVADMERLLTTLIEEATSGVARRKILLSPALTDLFFGILESPKRKKIAYLPMAVLADGRLSATGDGIMTLRQHLLLRHIDTIATLSAADNQASARLRNAAIGAIGMLDMMRVETRNYLYATFFATTHNQAHDERTLAPPMAHADGFLSPFWAEHRDVIRVESASLTTINHSAPTAVFFFLPASPTDTLGDPNVLVWIIKPISGQPVVFYWSYDTPFLFDTNYSIRDYTVRKRIEETVGTLDNLAIFGDLIGNPASSPGGQMDEVSGKYILIDAMLPILQEAARKNENDDDALMQYHFRLGDHGNGCILLHVIAQELCKAHNAFCDLKKNRNEQIKLGSVVTDYARNVIDASTSSIMQLLISNNPKALSNSLNRYIAPLSTVL